MTTAIWFSLAAVPLLLFVAAVNSYYWDGDLLGPFGVMYGPQAQEMLEPGRLVGIAGLLVSPNRGLFVFTPIALLGVIGLARQVVSRTDRDVVLVSFGAAALGHLFVSGTYYEWWGGWSFGPRYLVDILPVLALAGATAWQRLPTWTRRLALIFVFWSCAVQFNDAFCYPASRWNPRVLLVHRANAPWLWSEFELWQDCREWRTLRMWSAPWR